MRNARLDEAQAGIKIVGRNIYQLTYTHDTTLMAEMKYGQAGSGRGRGVTKSCSFQVFRFFSLRGSCKVIRLLSRAGIGSRCSWIVLTYSLRVHVQPDLLSGPPAPPRPQSFFSSRSQASTSASYSSVHPTPRKKSFLKLSHRFSPPRLMMAGDRKTDRSEEFRKSSGGRLLRSAR